MRRPVAIFLIAATVLVCGVLGSALAPSTNRLPGIDSGNLYAWEVYTRTVLGEGRLPFWNPYHFAGTPHLPDPQTTVLYPPALLLRWLPAPAFLGWMMGLHLLIAAAGALFAARVFGLGWLPASAAAVAVMLGGSVPGWIHNGHLLLLYSVAWVPWAFALAVLSVRSGRWLPDGRLVAVLVLQFLGGYLQGSLYLAIAVAGYFVFSTVWRDQSAAPAPRWQPFVQLALLGVLGGAAAAFQLLPTATLVSQAARSAGIDYANALEGSWTPRDLATMYFPFYGIDQTPVYRYLSDRLVYVGWTLTAFAPFAFVLRDRLRIAVFLAALVLAAFAVALGDTLGVYRLHHALLPGLRVPGRVLFLATFALAMLGGLGIDAFATAAARREWRRLVLPAVLTAAAAAAAGYTGGRPAQSAAALVQFPWWTSWQAALAAGTLIVAAAGLAGWRQTALTLALLTVAVDVTAVNARAMETVPLDSAGEIRASIGAPTGGRSISLCENRISARELLLNREPTLDGLPGLHLRDYGDWAFVAKTGEAPAGDGMYRRIGSEGEPPARADLIDLANVTRVVSCDGRADGGLVVTTNNRAWPRAVWVCGTDEVSRHQGIIRLVNGRYDRTHALRPRRYIRIKWAPQVDDARRAARESAHGLQDGVPIEDGAWRYALADPSPAAVIAIMVDPDVNDTHGVDRRTGVITEVPDDGSESGPDAEEHRYVLVGERSCPEGAQVATVAADRTDGLVAARVSAPSGGVLFFSEPFYSERRAYVDGKRVDAYRADLAFTAVPVPAGYHRVELRYTPTSFYLGSLVSGVTGAGYLGAGLRRRKRRR